MPAVSPGAAGGPGNFPGWALHGEVRRGASNGKNETLNVSVCVKGGKKIIAGLSPRETASPGGEGSAPDPRGASWGGLRAGLWGRAGVISALGGSLEVEGTG